jgi:beta-lactamase regulating signal transducer with metallopeptidase domain
MSITVEPLTAALLHSLWQNAILGLLLATALIAMRRSSANSRYLVCCAALGLMVALPVATAIVLSDRPVANRSSTSASLATTQRVEEGGLPHLAMPPVTSGPMAWLMPLTPWVLPVWLVGVLVCSLRLLAASAHAVVLRRHSDPEDGPIAATVARLAARVGVRRSVAVRLSMRTDSLATLGLWRPVILLPPAVALGVTPQQLEALLAHELAHIRRHDFLINLLQMLVETLFFYHPAVWWTSKRIRVERELCCDDIAVEACGDAIGYAQALTAVARLQISRPGLALGATGGPFVQRIQRLLGVATTRRPIYPVWVIAASLVMIVAVMFTGSSAQSTSPGTLAPTDTEAASSLTGRVVDARSGRPIAGARVRAQYITGSVNPPKCPIGDCEDILDPVAGRLFVYRATTGRDGHFSISNVRTGDYLVAATAPGYVQRFFGETSNDTPETSLHVAPGQRTPSIDIPLELAGSVSGRILSDAGEGLEGVEVELLRRTYVPGGSRPIAVAFAQTEDKGAYRFGDVTPGEYYVRAYASAALAPTRKDVPRSYVPTLFPEATDIEYARPVVLGDGDELGGIDFALATSQRRSVAGRLVDPDGASLTTARIQLLPHSTGVLDEQETSAAADGTFRFASVPAGHYLVTVFDTSGRRSWNTAVHDLPVFDDVTDLRLTAGPSVVIIGRVTGENGQPLPFDATDLQMTLEQQTSTLGINSAGFAKVSADGSFAMRSGAGSLQLRVGGVPPRWFVKSVRLNEVDVTDKEFELAPGGQQRFEVTLTNRVSRLAGTVTDRSARPVTNAIVIVFPEDRARWTSTRSIRTTFSHQQGLYEVESLPMSRYRAVAVTSLPRNAWADPDVLARLLSASSSISLDELGQGTLHLRVVEPPTDLLQ